MYSLFGVKEKQEPKKKKNEPSEGRIKKEPKEHNPQTLYKRFRYLIYDSKDADPTIRAKEENVYRMYFVYPGTNEAIEDPSRHLVWFFYDNPNDPDSTVSNINAQHYPVSLALRTWKDPKQPTKTKRADVVCVKYQGKNYSILYAGSSHPPKFYIEVYNQEDPRNPLKLYGMLATSFTPPSSPMRSQFGKKSKKTKRVNLKSLNKDLRRLMKC